MSDQTKPEQTPQITESTSPQVSKEIKPEVELEAERFVITEGLDSFLEVGDLNSVSKLSDQCVSFLRHSLHRMQRKEQYLSKIRDREHQSSLSLALKQEDIRRQVEQAEQDNMAM
eukprot:gnl/Dysnectes_brevis/1471_a1665_3096.p1 GENE.gnl/Dysnectes_brevis/1471_a1665_3096~~gnl/Dysnectes_brevis/1471_a1665_3096.p1  ORF type:complete len:115 (-),score=19.32 gnl/Dysnectes_brevis/1471_a1665_3096:63-407(-)